MDHELLTTVRRKKTEDMGWIQVLKTGGRYLWTADTKNLVISGGGGEGMVHMVVWFSPAMCSCMGTAQIGREVGLTRIVS
jgi:hypothetical protein